MCEPSPSRTPRLTGIDFLFAPPPILANVLSILSCFFDIVEVELVEVGDAERPELNEVDAMSYGG